jgi:hypothetical protein
MGRIDEHWKRWMPSMYKSYKADGQEALDKALRETAEHTLRYAETLQEQGYSAPEAASEAMREIALALYRND